MAAPGRVNSNGGKQGEPRLGKGSIPLLTQLFPHHHYHQKHHHDSLQIYSGEMTPTEEERMSPVSPSAAAWFTLSLKLYRDPPVSGRRHGIPPLETLEQTGTP